MNTCKNKLILFLASALICAAAFSLAGCTGNGQAADGTDKYGQSANDTINDKDYNNVVTEPAVVAIPGEIELNGITYNIVIGFNEEFKSGELLGFWVNREDYQALCEKDPDSVYFIDERNSILNEQINLKYGAYNIFGVYSVRGYDSEQYIGLGSDTGMSIVYVNRSYNAGD